MNSMIGLSTLGGLACLMAFFVVKVWYSKVVTSQPNSLY